MLLWAFIVFFLVSSIESLSSSSSPLKPEFMAEVIPELIFEWMLVWTPLLKEAMLDFLVTGFLLIIMSLSRIWFEILVVIEVFISYVFAWLLRRLERFGVSGYCSSSLITLKMGLISYIELCGDNCFFCLFLSFSWSSDSLNLFFLLLGESILPRIRFWDWSCTLEILLDWVYP